jgi:hypothetical protein
VDHVLGQGAALPNGQSGKKHKDRECFTEFCGAIDHGDGLSRAMPNKITQVAYGLVKSNFPMMQSLSAEDFFALSVL